MDSLALVVHAIVTYDGTVEMSSLSGLSEIERGALTDSHCLLQLTPQQLAISLAQGRVPFPWIDPKDTGQAQN